MIKADPTPILEWFKIGTNAQAAELRQLFDSDAYLFVAHGASGGTAELEITLNAMEDYSTDEILGDLQAAKVLERVAKDSSLRVQYFADRTTPNFETKHVRCDGVPYRVVRDAHHNVRIYDGSDRVLENMPTVPLVITESVFRRPDSSWCADIRNWRGNGQ